MAAAAARGKRKRAPAAPEAAAHGGAWLLALGVGLGVCAAAFPVVMTRLCNDEAVTGAFLAPLVIWAVAFLLALWWSRPSRFAGERAFVGLTFLLLGLGIVVQLRLGTWVESWQAYRAYAPLIGGLVGFLFCLRLLSANVLAGALVRLKGVLWLAALAILALLRLCGHAYRGGMFLPGQINPTELVKLCLVAFTAAWLPAHAKALSRTCLGVPLPPWREGVELAVLWGVPLAGALAVRDLGLVLILCLTLLFMLAGATRRWGWCVAAFAVAPAAGWAVSRLSAHTATRFAVWLDPFQDPTGKGWQIAQSLCAQYAGGLWGSGLGEGMPGRVPIVTSDFVYAAVAEEWGLVGCALLLALVWVWLARAFRIAAAAEEPTCRLLAFGLAVLLGVEVALNIGGVTKALPMTGIALPLFSQGGFSLLATLLLCGLLCTCSKPRRG